MDIIWKGNKHTNKSSRRGHIPDVIVNHVVGGSAKSCISWFTSPNNNVSSAHFLVSKDGNIYQFVDIKESSWASGLTSGLKHATADIVHERGGLNPNRYSISIEHEGTNGELTDKQLEATIFLHKHIKEEINRIYGKKIELSRKNVIGHFEIDNKRKPYCPGPKFPWDELMNRLDKNYNNFLNIDYGFIKDKTGDKIMNTSDYWKQNAIPGKTCDGKYVGYLLKNLENYLKEV